MAKDLVKKIIQIISQYAQKARSSWCFVIYDQLEVKSNGLNLDVTDFTFDLQLSKLRLSNEEEITTHESNPDIRVEREAPSRSAPKIQED